MTNDTDVRGFQWSKLQHGILYGCIRFSVNFRSAASSLVHVHAHISIAQFVQLAAVAVFA